MATLGPKARSLIDGGRRALRPTEADRVRVEAALRAQLGPVALPPQGATVPPPVAAASGWKVAASAVIGAGLVGAALHLASGPGAATMPPAAVPPTTSVAATKPADEPVVPVAPPVPETDTAPVPTTPPAVAPAGGASAEAAGHAPRSTDRLAEEVALLSRATRALRTGNAREALAALEEHQSRFPRGVLTEERRAAKAQALCALGRVAEGRAELARLGPKSPGAANARKICEGGS